MVSPHSPRIRAEIAHGQVREMPESPGNPCQGPAAMIAKPLLPFVILLALLASRPVAGTNADPAIELAHLVPEGYAYSEEDADLLPSEGHYLALVCVANACHLEPARLEWAFEQAHFDELPMPLAVVRGEVVKGLVALLRGLPDLRPGPVATEIANHHFPATQDGERSDSQTRPLNWRSAAGNRQLASTTTCPDYPCLATWTLRDSRGIHVIGREYVGESHGPFGVLSPRDALIWAGDLDRDGQVDLIVRPQEQPNYMHLRLLLGRDRPHDTDATWPEAATFLWWDPLAPGC